jgi:hypothetical protein
MNTVYFKMACTVRDIRFNLPNQLYTHYNVKTIEKQEKLVRHAKLFILVENSPEKQNDI